MNKFSKTFIACAALLTLCLTAASAQEKENPWFIQGQIGASYSSGDVPFGKLIGPSAQLAVGKYFTHVWGARLAFSGWQGRVGELNTNKANSFYYGAVTVDGLMNLSQLIKRYHERPFDVGIIAGVGFNRSFSQSGPAGQHAHQRGAGLQRGTDGQRRLRPLERP